MRLLAEFEHIVFKFCYNCGKEDENRCPTTEASKKQQQRKNEETTTMSSLWTSSRHIILYKNIFVAFKASEQ